MNIQRQSFVQIIKRGRLYNAVWATDVVPEQLVAPIAVEGLELRIRLTRVASLVGLLVAGAIAFDFHATTQRPSVLAAFLALAITYLALFGFTTAWPVIRRRIADFGRAKAAFNRLIFALGVFWATYLVLLMRASDSANQALLLSIMIGLISTTISAGPLSSTLSFWAPLTVGAFTALYVSHDLWRPVFVITLGAYSAFVFFTMVVLNRRMLERSVNALELMRTSETIQMLLRDFEENASDWLWETDAALNLVHPSARLAEVAHRPASEIRGNLFDFMAGTDAALASPADPAIDPYAELRRQIRMRRPFRDLVVPVSAAGERRWWSLTGKPTLDHEGAFAGYRGVGSDVTAMQRSRQRIDFLAQHDTLTELINRAAFGVLLDRALAPGNACGAALLYLDLDQFKAVNDSYGHGLGDILLRAVASRLRNAIRETDTAARLGGDEFAVLLPSNSRIDATAMADRIIERLSRPYRFDGVSVEIGVSIGIALAPADGDRQDLLFRNADLALYRAKNDGRGTWRLFDQAMDRQVQNQRSLRRDIKRALHDGQLFVEYQPVVCLRTRRIRSVEALVRWRHPQRGIIGPEDFIAIAERCGLIGAVTRHVLTEAASLAIRLPSSVSVAINLSALHLREALLFDQLSAVISTSGLAPERVEFEVTETALLTTDDRTIDNLRRLRRFGCRIAIDDFGTGFASLSTLRSFPFDRLKIDRSFIHELGRAENGERIVKAIVEFGQTLGLLITVEGVETEEHAAMLYGYRDIDAQGYLFSPPVSGDRIVAITGSGVATIAPAEPATM
ncbi:putative bifunctional diguanylate cyclase/phosphodiesterase [Acidiphilium cryptum]|uniref:putative bifunctional diguanylate cyclase/phosphodiesterase n=1 Tax=Acidiphilium cryptum TaxID=524 RepID=UPI0005BD2250|nr:EAL domain-containing protein [Acidiphilium cryptum]UNC16098.1 EAL domain-containing protein [Acidiphilium multivorum]